MTMYVHLLASAFDDWVDGLIGEALVDYTVVCRAEMLASQSSVHHHKGESAYIALAAEVAYDRALLKLCTACGIEASTQGFSHPSDERLRLERELVGMGVDLMAPVRDGEMP